MTTEQQLARMLVAAIKQLGGHLYVTEDQLDKQGGWNIVWEHVEPVKDEIGIKLSLRSGEVLIAHVDNDVATVVL